MNRVGEVCSVRLNGRMTVAVKKKEWELAQWGGSNFSTPPTTQIYDVKCYFLLEF